MQAPISSVSRDFTAVIDALCKIANSYLFDARLADAQQVMRLALQLVETNDVEPADRIKLLLQYGRILIVDRHNPDLTISTLQEAKKLAESTHQQQSLADAFNLLAEAHRFAVILNNNALEGFDGKFDESLNCQRQAMELYEALHDTRGISAAHFGFGNVYQFTQQSVLAHEHFVTARQIAEDNGHLYERTEPTRHLALLALNRGDLDQSLDYAREALAFREEVNFIPYLPLDHILLSSVYLAKSDTTNALSHVEKALAIAEKIGYQAGVVFALLSLGDIQLSQTDQQARTTYEKAFALAQKLQQPLLIGMAFERVNRVV